MGVDEVRELAYRSVSPVCGATRDAAGRTWMCALKVGHNSDQHMAVGKIMVVHVWPVKA